MCSFYNSITINWKQVFSDECDDTNITRRKTVKLHYYFIVPFSVMGLADRLVIYKIKFDEMIIKLTKKGRKFVTINTSVFFAHILRHYYQNWMKISLKNNFKKSNKNVFNWAQVAKWWKRTSIHNLSIRYQKKGK